jgi:hypothetical protein
MIRQIAMYMADPDQLPTKEDVAQITDYEGINIIQHVKQYPVTIIFEHEKKLSLKKLNIKSPWVVAPQTTYHLAEN